LKPCPGLCIPNWLRIPYRRKKLDRKVYFGKLKEAAPISPVGSRDGSGRKRGSVDQHTSVIQAIGAANSRSPVLRTNSRFLLGRG
jgi:hypothetical protein